jgi:hypothetical protein
MRAYEKVRKALGDLLSAEVKDADGATCSASTHRNAAIVLLHGLVPDYSLDPHELHLEQVLRQAHEEMKILGAEDRYMSGERL